MTKGEMGVLSRQSTRTDKTDRREGCERGSYVLVQHTEGPQQQLSDDDSDKRRNGCNQQRNERGNEHKLWEGCEKRTCKNRPGLTRCRPQAPQQRQPPHQCCCWDAFARDSGDAFAK